MPPRKTRPDPWVETLGWLMDNSISIGRWRIGLDGLIGLIPGVGDFTGAAVSALIVARAATAGIPRATVARMIANVAIDALLGAIPLVGDVFDFAFKTNARNISLYREALVSGNSTQRDWRFVGLVFFALIAVLASTCPGTHFSRPAADILRSAIRASAFQLRLGQKHSFRSEIRTSAKGAAPHSPVQNKFLVLDASRSYVRTEKLFALAPFAPRGRIG